MSFSMIVRLSRICMIVAVSVMSCVVAPQWHHSPRPPLQSFDQLRHHRQHRVADALGLLLQLLDVELVELALLEDFLARLLRDDAEPGLRAGQPGLEVEILLDAVAVRPHLPHGLGAENVAEDGGVDGAGGHGGPFTSQMDGGS